MLAAAAWRLHRHAQPGSQDSMPVQHGCLTRARESGCKPACCAAIGDITATEEASRIETQGRVHNARIQGGLLGDGASRAAMGCVGLRVRTPGLPNKQSLLPCQPQACACACATCAAASCLLQSWSPAGPDRAVLGCRLQLLPGR